MLSNWNHYGTSGRKLLGARSYCQLHEIREFPHMVSYLDLFGTHLSCSAHRNGMSMRLRISGCWLPGTATS